MTYLVNDKCIRCKHTDCVEICPVDCFYEGPNMLVINPDECIDCGVCVPECPVDAIIEDTEAIEEPQDQLTPEAPDNLFVINLEGEDKTIAYKHLISILEEHSSNYSNEGGWFRIFSDDHYFSLVNGLNPGRFDISKEDDETTALTLILSPVSGTNTISNLNQMVTFAELLASKLDLNLFDSERNPLTQQMIDHYSHQAEDFDLRNFA